MKKGFALVEFLVAITIGVVVLSMIFSLTKGLRSPDKSMYFWPERASAIQQKRMADQLERQNDLMEEQMRQKRNAEKY
jgi:prepilin-type N-terminal cleavage/methylation domain-containing protein